jgi:hypothetical protein
VDGTLTWAQRTFRLLDYLGIKRGREGRIEHYYKDTKGVCPTNFSNIGKIGKIYPKTPPEPPAVFDPFEVNSGLPEDGRIPDK